MILMLNYQLKTQIQARYEYFLINYIT